MTMPLAWKYRSISSYRCFLLSANLAFRIDDLGIVDIEWCRGRLVPHTVMEEPWIGIP